MILEQRTNQQWSHFTNLVVPWAACLISDIEMQEQEDTNGQTVEGMDREQVHTWGKRANETKTTKLAVLGTVNRTERGEFRKPLPHRYRSRASWAIIQNRTYAWAASSKCCESLETCRNWALVMLHLRYSLIRLRVIVFWPSDSHEFIPVISHRWVCGRWKQRLVCCLKLLINQLRNGCKNRKVQKGQRQQGSIPPPLLLISVTMKAFTKHANERQLGISNLNKAQKKKKSKHKNQSEWSNLGIFHLSDSFLG